MRSPAVSASVSVIVATWNRAGPVIDAIRSALAQTHPVAEVLVCDDGSTDGTKEAVLSLRDLRVRFLPGAHAGHAAVPRNHGIAAATGDWLAFLDSDDSWAPGKIETQLRLASERRCQAASSNAIRVVPEHGAVGNYLQCAASTISFRTLLRMNLVICSTAIVHRTVLARTGGFPEDPRLRVGEDYALWLRVATQTDFAYADVPLATYQDDPSHSLRVHSLAEPAQRESILKDWHDWAAANPALIQRSQMRAGRSALRRAMRRNGRGVVERWSL